MDWSKYPNFSRKEFECSATGFCDMDPEFMEQMQILREIYGKPMVITSGYRDAIEHPIEANKTRPGAHAYGVAADIKVAYSDAHELLHCAIELNVFNGIGIAQKGDPDKRFIHLDMATSEMLDGGLRPTIWSY
ncbi:D-Ala-D-Ala carboxypeptidase family metallohydrolase [Limnobacter sp.]|uniref:D-Ala-D-Ala carboxypeptidase family metallohydrolase n=1 Tax=Limnobacter sp. TaxID=2003368 RepID=UPI0025B7AEE3|nr:D-Ala-D-Ala carboxypeptidase family metallohydrolase [Limnobacter sp.]